MTDISRAVFLSYASEDAEAAQRIADALRAAGIEVWFDKSELRGGDAWDHQIRQQIHDCRLFMPVISANSESRDEGYFRREWKLAVDRTHDMADKRAFLVPVAIDGTPERGASVPDKFLDLQWTRLPGGETPAAFVWRIRTLLSPGSSHQPQAQGPHFGPGVAGVSAGRLEQRRYWPLAFGLAVFGLVLASLGVGRFWLSKHRSEPAVAASTTTGPEARLAAPSDKSVAVLPLRNESGDPKQEYFSDGLSENLINALSHVPELKVIGRTSSFQFRDTKLGSKAIGEQLGVARLIEGSVQREGSTIRVSAELINAADGRTLWSERYDRPYKSLFALQDEISQALAQALKARLLPSAQAQSALDRPPSGNPDAYILLLQGRYYNSLGTGPNLNTAANFLRRAVELDPNYAAAWAELGGSYYVLTAFAYIEPARNRALALEAFARAVALAPNDASVRQLSAVLKIQYDHDPKGAAADIAAAEHSDPTLTLLEMLAFVTGGVPGPYYERYIRDLSATIDRDPLNAPALEERGLARYFAGELRAAEADYRRILTINPEYGDARYYIAAILVAEHRPAQALAIASDETLAVNRKAARAFALVALGRRAEAEAELREMIAHDADDGPREIAEVCAALGEKQKALDWLQKDYDGHHAGVFYLRSDPLLQSVADEPRFRALMDKIWPGS